MKHLKSFVPMLAAVAALFSGVLSAADEKEDLLARFDRELLIVMSGFSEACNSGVASPFRQEYLKSFDKFVSDAEALQAQATRLGIGEDLNLAAHARNIRAAFQTSSRNSGSSATPSNSKDKKKSNVAKANDPLTRMTGKSLSEHAGLETAGMATATQNQTSVGFSFHMAGNAVQTLSSLGFGLRNGAYSVSPRFRSILPYLELKRDVEYFSASYEHFDTLITIAPWRSDFEKRLKRMSNLAVQVQPVYRTYFPGKTAVIGTEVSRLSGVYNKFVEYVRATQQAEQANSRLSDKSAFDQVRQSNIPDKGVILRDYDTAASRFAEIFADMDSVDWTVNAFSEKKQSSSKNDMVSLPSKSSN